MRQENIGETRCHDVAAAIAAMLLKDVLVNYWCIDGFPEVKVNQLGDVCWIVLSIYGHGADNKNRVESSFSIESKVAQRIGDFFRKHGGYSESEHEVFKSLQSAIAMLEGMASK